MLLLLFIFSAFHQVLRLCATAWRAPRIRSYGDLRLPFLLICRLFSKIILKRCTRCVFHIADLAVTAHDGRRRGHFANDFLEDRAYY